MAKKRKRPTRQKPDPPVAPYPVPPHLIGTDWIELPVGQPPASAALYCSIGFAPRATSGTGRAVAIGGTVLMFRRRRPTPGSRTTAGARPDSGVVIQVPVDHVDLKRQQMIEMGLSPGRLTSQKRGDRAFLWRDGDGHTIRFVGPARRQDDKTLV